MSIVLYTLPNCPYCVTMKGLLEQTEFSFDVVDVKEDPSAREFLKEQGHRTAPQLYVNGVHINAKNTEEYTAEELTILIKQVDVSTGDVVDWPGIDSGIEQGY